MQFKTVALGNLVHYLGLLLNYNKFSSLTVFCIMRAELTKTVFLTSKLIDFLLLCSQKII